MASVLRCVNYQECPVAGVWGCVDLRCPDAPAPRFTRERPGAERRRTTPLPSCCLTCAKLRACSSACKLAKSAGRSGYGVAPASPRDHEVNALS